MMFLEIITPEKKVYSGEVTSVHLPGEVGEFQVLHNHAPVISTLVKGKVKILPMSEDGKKRSDEKTIVEISGGVVEVLKNKIIVLAEMV